MSYASSSPESTQNHMPKKWVLASNNKGKLAEFKRLFAEANLDVTIVPQGQLGIENAVEDFPPTTTGTSPDTGI